MKQALALFASGLEELPDTEIERLFVFYTEQATQATVLELPDVTTGELCGFALTDLIALTERERVRRRALRLNTGKLAARREAEGDS